MATRRAASGKKTRRRYGSGSVRQLPSGNWRARLWADGVRRETTHETKALAEEWLKKSKPGKAVVDAYGAPDRGSKPDATFEDAAALLEDVWAARGRTADSIRGYRSHLAAALEDWGDRVIADAKPGDFNVWIAAEQKSGRAARTLLQRLVMLSQTMKAAVEAGWIPAVPCAVPRPRVVAKSERTCTPEAQFEKLLKAATKSKDPRHLALLLLAADAGLRRGEIGRLLGRHVLLGGDGETWWGTLHIAVISESSRTKSGKGRTVPILSPQLHDALRATFAGPDDPVLRVAPDGDGVRKLADELWEKAKLGPGSRLHELRHRWVTRLLVGGEPPVNVQAWAGHANILTTMGYVHTTAAPSPRAALALEAPSRRPRKGGSPKIGARIGHGEV